MEVNFPSTAFINNIRVHRVNNCSHWDRSMKFGIRMFWRKLYHISLGVNLKKIFKTYICINPIWRQNCELVNEKNIFCSLVEKYFAYQGSEYSIHASTHPMMTSSNGNIFRVTGHLCGEFTGLSWIPRTKASDAELWYFLWSESE